MYIGFCWIGSQRLGIISRCTCIFAFHFHRLLWYNTFRVIAHAPCTTHTRLWMSSIWGWMLNSEEKTKERSLLSLKRCTCTCSYTNLSSLKLNAGEEKREKQAWHVIRAVGDAQYYTNSALYTQHDVTCSTDHMWKYTRPSPSPPYLYVHCAQRSENALKRGYIIRITFTRRYNMPPCVI